jgi:hypothetical protein
MGNNGQTHNFFPAIFEPENILSGENNTVSVELVNCLHCTRKNNPLRPNCIYCGATLPQSSELSELTLAYNLTLQKDKEASFDRSTNISNYLQQNLPGFNVILLPLTAEQQTIARETLAKYSAYDSNDIDFIISQLHPWPLAHLLQEAAAQLLCDQLQRATLPTLLLSDEKHQLTNALPRLRTCKINQQEITLIFDQSKQSPVTIPATAIQLIVEGRIRHRHCDTKEENKGLGQRERELTQAVEFIDEQLIMDIYTADLATSFRIRSESFDYSGLAQKMKLTALENFRALLSTLREIAPQAKLHAAFRQHSRLLERVWPSTQRQESLGLRRAKFLTMGRISTRSAYYQDNEEQFNRYSRVSYYTNLLNS